MPNIDEKIERFTNAITSDAQSDSKAILEEVRRVRESSLATAEDEALSDAYQYIKNEIGRIRTEYGRMVSRKMMDNKRVLYAKRAELAEAVLRDVLEKLADYVKQPGYVKHLAELIAQALEEFEDAPTIVSLRQEDMALEDQLKPLLGKRQVTFEKGRFHLGGMTAECLQKQQQINQTFDANFEDWKTRFFAELVIPGTSAAPQMETH